MKTKVKIILLAALCISSSTAFAQSTQIIEPQSASNLFDANVATNWVSSFTGETFPIDLEINLGGSETITALMLQQSADASLKDFKVADFELYIKDAVDSSYPQLPTLTGKAATDLITPQWFTLPSEQKAACLLLRVKSVSGATAFTAALSELGVRSSKKNGEIITTSFNQDAPYDWSGITWTDAEPLQVSAVNWSGKAQMKGVFPISKFAQIGTNYDFTGTQITLEDITGISTATGTDKGVSITISESGTLSIASTSTVSSVVITTTSGISKRLTLSDGQANISGLAAGIYVVTVNTSNGSVSKQFVKK